ncbi:MAG: LysM peptidoglycan-binding domain-containing protein [Clostridiales bacterium]|nr:LysM peptidoglycan-binding domain-containing protein [Clostridiales bacterium]
MRIHVVQPGETITGIAQIYGVSAARIISDNAISDPGRLVVGQALIILIPETTYTVMPGDTLFSVSERFGVDPLVLVQNNPELAVNAQLYPGQVLIIKFEGAKRRSIATNGYAYPFIERTILLRALPFLTRLTIFGYGFDLNGNLTVIDDQPLINLAYQFRTAPVMLLSAIDQNDVFNSYLASALFQDAALQDKVLDNVVAVMAQKGYLGLDIDFEFIPPESREGFIGFVQKATTRLNSLGYFVNTDLAPKTSAGQSGLLYESHDYPAIGAASNTVLIMTYEWGYTYGPPMAVAPLNQVRKVVEYAVSEIPVSKIFMGIPNYGYVWPLPFEQGVTQATTIGNEYAVRLALQNGVNIQFDELGQSPWFEYQAFSESRVVWFEDVRSIEAKFNLIDEFNLFGGAYWNLMRPFHQNWAYLSAVYDILKTVS